MDANLIVTYDPTHEGKARAEVESVTKAEFLDSETDGVFLLKVDDPRKVVKSLSGSFENTFQWIPVDEWTSSKPGDMQAVTKKFNSKMDDKKSWKLDLNTRHYDASSTGLIEKLTEPIDKKKVDLDSPDTIVAVNIFGDKAALSLLDKSEFVNTHAL